MAEDGGENKRRKKGGLKTMPFILGNEICDKFAIAGIGANLVSYLITQLHLPLVEASNTLSNFTGTSNLTPIFGALVADSFAGRFWTITAGSLFYQLGMILLTISGVLPVLRPPKCTPPQPCQRASMGQLMVLYSSLLLTSIGAGGIRPCVAPFGADQFELHKPKKHKWNYFNLYYFTLGLSLLLALTVVVYIQDNVGWGLGFGIPSIAMFLSVVAFVIGYPLYIMIKPAGSPLTRLFQVLVGAFKKRKVAKPDDPNLLYVDKELDADISTTGRLLHTEQLRFLDRAAIITDGDITDSGHPKLWRLSTVHRVEELKSVIRMLPIWSVGILVTTSASHNYSFTIMQARSMDRHLTPHGIQIPAATFSIFSVTTMLLGLAFYDQAFVPLARRFTGRPNGITYLQRMGIGLAISILSTLVAALVETKRKKVAADYGLLDNTNAVVPISAFWLVPQYAIHGFADAFTSVALIEFLYDQSPESMRSTAMALFSLAGSIGGYMGTLLVTLVSEYTKRRGNWLQDNINRGKLDYYYWLVTLLQVFNLAYYVVCSRSYTFKPLEMGMAEEGKGGVGDVELAAEGGGEAIKESNGKE